MKVVSRARVAIVGPAEFKDKIMPAFFKKFSTVMYFPSESVKLSVGKKTTAIAGNLDIGTFHYVLLLPKQSKKEFYCTLSAILSKRTKVSAPKDTLLYFWNRPAMLRRISSAGVPIERSASISQDVAFNFIKDNFKFPIVLTTPKGKEIRVNKEETLKDVLSLFSAGHTVSIRKPMKNAEEYVTFVSEKETVGFKVVNDKKLPVKVGSDISSLAQKVRRKFNLDFCSIKFIKKGKKICVRDIKLVPDFEAFFNVSGKDVATVMANEIIHKITVPDISELFEKTITGIGKIIDKAARWVSNEISNLRAFK